MSYQDSFCDQPNYSSIFVDDGHLIYFTPSYCDSCVHQRVFRTAAKVMAPHELFCSVRKKSPFYIKTHIYTDFIIAIVWDNHQEHVILMYVTEETTFAINHKKYWYMGMFFRQLNDLFFCG